LVQKEEPRISPYEDVHLNMGKLFAYVYNIQPSYVFMVVHEGNRSNRVYKLDRYFEDIEEKLELRNQALVKTKIEPIKVVKQIPKLISIKKPIRGSNWRARMVNG